MQIIILFEFHCFDQFYYSHQFKMMTLLLLILLMFTSHWEAVAQWLYVKHM